MRFSVLAALIWLSASVASAQPGATGVISPALSPRNASYSIEARLDPATRTITGSERITWRNITTRTANDLQFHLYWNAWRDDRSTWMRENRLGARRRLTPIRDHERSSIDVTSIQIAGANGSIDLTGKAHFIAPDDGNTDDRTVLAVPLPQPAAPGATVVVELKWKARVPRTFARTGAIGNFFFLAQWFPKLGVLQDDGWNCHQFHASTEFFSDYGTYDAKLTVPRNWPVGATGVRRERVDNSDGTTTHRYYQDDVHDFAWTTSPDYIEERAKFEHPTLPAVDMVLVLQPEHAKQAARHFEATRATLKYYGEWFGAYPYGHITIVDPAFQSGADGMEYPTLFTAGTNWLAPEHAEDPEDVTIHEAGHQWWYAMVGSNEFEDAWLDEGLNTFSEARVMNEWYAPTYFQVRYFGGFVPHLFRDIRLSRETFWNRRRAYRLNPKSDDPSMPSFRFYPAQGRLMTYNKTALWLNTMERWIGWPTTQRILSTFFDRWKFKHPKPADFFGVASEVAGRDLGGYFDQVYRSSNAFDYGIQDLSSESDKKIFRTNVVVRRYGEATFPVDVRVIFENGEKVTEHWDGRDRWKLYTYDRAAKAISAEVDPDRVLLLDVNFTNNSRTLKPQGRAAATKWSLKWMVWLQDCLLSWSALV